MANFFDQFDGASSAPAQEASASAPNYFDQFDAPQAVAQSAPQQQSALDKLLGNNGQRYQTWPERLVRGLVGAAQDAAQLPGQYVQEATEPKSTISDSDVSVLSAPNALNFAGFASGVSPSSRGGIKTGFTTPATPSRTDLEAAKTAAYNDPAVTDLRLNPSVGPTLVNQVKSELIKNKLDPINAPNVLNTIANVGKARFEQPSAETQTVLSGPGYHIANDVVKSAPLQIADLDLTRQSLSSVPPEQARAAAIARKVIDNYLGNIPGKHVVAGDPAAANAKLLEARGNAAALFRDKTISDALTRADNQAGSTYSGTNLDNATRQQLRPILNDKMGVSKNKRAFQDYTPEEIAALRTAVNGTTLSNNVRRAGKLFGAGHGIGALGAAYATTEALHGAGLPFGLALTGGLGMGAGGAALNTWANALRASEAQTVSELLRRRSPLAQQLAPVPINAPLPGAYPALGLLGGRSLAVMPAGAQPQQ